MIDAFILLTYSDFFFFPGNHRLNQLYAQAGRIKSG